jgi:hypothetical protein
VKEDYIRWNTPYLGGRVFEMLVFGHAGHPVILFPTSQARYYEYKDFRLIEAAAALLDAGRVKIYCPDGMDGDSWYNRSIHPADRSGPTWPMKTSSCARSSSRRAPTPAGRGWRWPAAASRLSRDQRGVAPSRPGVQRDQHERRRWAKHDWPLWWDMFPRYLTKL